MIRLLVLACLLAAAAAQATYYCNPGGNVISDRDFYFVTRRGASESFYPQGLVCELNLSPGIGIMLDFINFNLRTAVLSVSEGSKTHFRSSLLQKYQSSIVASSGYLRVRFDSTGDYSNSVGVTMRIRLFDSNRCPTGWTYLYGNCFGTSNVTGDLDYLDAQRACNSMSANLLIMPSGYFGSVANFMRMLPTHLRQYYTFIGLTDRTNVGQYYPYWLNSVRFLGTLDISCVSGGSYSTCYSYERCGTFNHKSFLYSIYMDSCSSIRDYACSMPAGGSGIFYTVPDARTIVYPSGGYTVGSGIIWGAVVGSLFVLSLVIGGIYAGVRSNVHRTAGASSVVVSTGRVTVAPPTMAYPVQQGMQPPPPPMYPSSQGPMYPSSQGPMYPSSQGPMYPAPPPPAYNMVAGGAYKNGEYQ